jgi:hypothetical protein
MTTRKTILRVGISYSALTGLAILGLAFLTTTANASCADHGRGASPALPRGLMAKLAASPSAASGTIVGLWDVTYTTSDNQLFQESFETWHGDGTELDMANINPIEGNVCLGVWKQVGSEIHLHHVGWGFDNFGNLIGPLTFDVIDLLGAHGNSFSGSFDFKQYDTDGNVLLEVTGTTSATRIGVN